MPHEKRSKEQTWKEDELKESLKEINGDRSHGKSRRDKYGDDYKSSKDSSHSQRRGEDRDRRVREDGRDRDRHRDGDHHRERKSDKSGDDNRRRREGERRDEDRRNGDKEKRHRDEGDSRDRRRGEEDRRTRQKDEKRDRDHRDEDRERRRRTEDGGSHGRNREDRDDRHRDSNRHSKHRQDDRSHREGDERERRHRKDDGDRRHRDQHLDRDEKHRDPDRKHRGPDETRDRKHGDHEDRERRHRAHDDERERRHRDREDDRERRHRDGEGDRERKRRDRAEDREQRHRDRDGERERRHRDDEHESKRRDHEGERDRKHRDRDDDRERSHRDRERDHRDRKHKYDDEEKDRRHREHDKSQDRKRDGKGKSDHDTDRRDHNRRDMESTNDDEQTRRRHDDRERKRRSERDGDKNREDRHRNDREYSDKKHRDSEGGDVRRDENRSKDREKEKSRFAEEALDGDYIKERSAKGQQRPKDEPEKEIRSSNSKFAEKISPSSKMEEHISASGADEDDYGGYDEDFEDYDDDFEDEEAGSEDDSSNMVNKMRSSDAPKSSNSEMEALYDALNAENERLLADSKNDFTEDSESIGDRHGNQRSTGNKPRGFINFVAAKQRDMNQKVASKARKRCTELLQLIELDTVHMTLFDLPPVGEYDLYMSSFGRTNAQQVYIQTNDDNLERDTQTEDMDTSTRWTQHPAEGVAVSGIGDGGGVSDQEVTSKYDEGKLSSFLQRTSQVMERLLNEENAKSSYKESSSGFSCSEAYVNLEIVEVFRSRQVMKCQFSPSDSSVLLTMHSSPLQTVDRKLDKYGMIGVWNTNDPSQPLKVVASASMPTCCCFSPIKATLVFGGMRDGSLVAWDLREPPTMHHSYICGNQDWLLRFPTYNTAGVLKYDNHSSPVTALEPVLTDNNKGHAQESGLGLSFQLATLDKSGTINLWVVAEIQETSMAGSESDLGLSPNGKIKLLKSSTISLANPSRNADLSGLCTLDLKLNPSNHNHLYVGTDAGVVIHSTRFGAQKVTPRAYTAGDMTPCAIKSVDLHPFGHPVLLAGCEDGSLRLHHLSSELPIVCWTSSTNGSPIQKVLWSRNCAYIMFVLDANSTIHMWDLLRNDAEPMTSDNLSRSNSRIVDMCLSEERTHSRPKMVFSYDDGTVQVHLLSSHVSNLQPGEDEQFTRFVEQL